MSFFSWLFGRDKPPAPPVVVKHIDNGGIAYDATLISKLKEDHQQLLSMFTKVTQVATEKRYNEIPMLLRQFKLALQTHLITENVRFYAYVQQHVLNNADESALVADLRKEMNDIARAAVQFIHRYETAVFTSEVADAFRQDLAGIGEVLVARINTEESNLYTLYLPKY